MIHPAHLAHVSTLKHAIAHSRAYCGLARCYTGWLLRAIGPVTIPAGWGARTNINEDCETVMPLWLAWLLDLWGNRWHWTLGRLQRWGLWQVTGKGHDYRVGRLVGPAWLAFAWAKVQRVTWCFLNDRDYAPLFGGPFRDLGAHHWRALNREGCTRISGREWRALVDPRMPPAPTYPSRIFEDAPYRARLRAAVASA